MALTVLPEECLGEICSYGSGNELSLLWMTGNRLLQSRLSAFDGVKTIRATLNTRVPSIPGFVSRHFNYIASLRIESIPGVDICCRRNSHDKNIIENPMVSSLPSSLTSIDFRFVSAATCWVRSIRQEPNEGTTAAMMHCLLFDFSSVLPNLRHLHLESTRLSMCSDHKLRTIFFLSSIISALPVGVESLFIDCKRCQFGDFDDGTLLTGMLNCIHRLPSLTHLLLWDVERLSLPIQAEGFKPSESLTTLSLPSFKSDFDLIANVFPSLQSLEAPTAGIDSDSSFPTLVENKIPLLQSLSTQRTILFDALSSPLRYLSMQTRTDPIPKPLLDTFLENLPSQLQALYLPYHTELEVRHAEALPASLTALAASWQQNIFAQFVEALPTSLKCLRYTIPENVDSTEMEMSTIPLNIEIFRISTFYKGFSTDVVRLAPLARAWETVDNILRNDDLTLAKRWLSLVRQYGAQFRLNQEHHLVQSSSLNGMPLLEPSLYGEGMSVFKWLIELKGYYMYARRHDFEFTFRNRQVRFGEIGGLLCRCLIAGKYDFAEHVFDTCYKHVDFSHWRQDMIGAFAEEVTALRGVAAAQGIVSRLKRTHTRWFRIKNRYDSWVAPIRKPIVLSVAAPILAGLLAAVFASGVLLDFYGILVLTLVGFAFLL